MLRAWKLLNCLPAQETFTEQNQKEIKKTSTIFIITVHKNYVKS